MNKLAKETEKLTNPFFQFLRIIFVKNYEAKIKLPANSVTKLKIDWESNAVLRYL